MNSLRTTTLCIFAATAARSSLERPRKANTSMVSEPFHAVSVAEQARSIHKLTNDQKTLQALGQKWRPSGIKRRFNGITVLLHYSRR